jgi:hypothetical protein
MKLPLEIVYSRGPSSASFNGAQWYPQRVVDLKISGNKMGNCDYILTTEIGPIVLYRVRYVDLTRLKSTP